jgi:hypothetical protein
MFYITITNYNTGEEQWDFFLTKSKCKRVFDKFFNQCKKPNNKFVLTCYNSVSFELSCLKDNTKIIDVEWGSVSELNKEDWEDEKILKSLNNYVEGILLYEEDEN